jgi:CelD/BcsL family acetyltransferase involved in cellulose biosynthesis
MHHAFLIHDDDTWIAGSTMLSHQDTLVAGVIHREREFDKYGPGVRLIDWNFQYAAEQGFRWIDIGGGQDYKHKWARESGSRWDVVVSPSTRYLARRAMVQGRAAIDRAKRALSRRSEEPRSQP